MVIFTSMMDYPVPFAPVHLLFINLINDSLPAIGIGVDDNLGDKDKKPRKTNKKILNLHSGFKMCFQGSIIAICTILAFLVGMEENIYVARTMAFATLALARLFHSFNCRGDYSILKNVAYNKTLFSATIIGIVLVNLLLFVPFLQNMFLVTPLSELEIIYVYVFSLLPTFVLQIIIIIKELIKKLIKLL